MDGKTKNKKTKKYKNYEEVRREALKIGFMVAQQCAQCVLMGRTDWMENALPQLERDLATNFNALMDNKDTAYAECVEILEKA